MVWKSVRKGTNRNRALLWPKKTGVGLEKKTCKSAKQDESHAKGARRSWAGNHMGNPGLGQNVLKVNKSNPEFIMKNSIVIIIAAGLCGLALTASSGFAQGSLTPPGAPGPTMLTLSQIEPRTPVDAIHTPGDASDLFIIRQPGSYYLTTNLTGATSERGIEILTNNVTLDLNGFALMGSPAGSSQGIYPSAAGFNVIVRNGTLTGWSQAIANSSSGTSGYVIFERLAIFGNFEGGNVQSCEVRDCLVTSNYTGGIAIDNNGLISGCEVSNNGSDGIDVYYGVVKDCRAINNGNDGIYVEASTVSDCYTFNNYHAGIYAYLSGSQIVGNNCINNNKAGGTGFGGIYLDGSDNRVEDNHLTGNGYAGISVNSTYSGNIIIKNTVSGSTGDYLTPGNQVVGPIISNTGTITNSNPWANFGF